MRRIFLYVTMILTVLAGHIHAQDCQIILRAYVLNRATKEPLEYASAGIIELSVGTTADSNGYFEIHDLCPGSYHIQVDHLGCTSVKRFIALRKDTTITVFLE